MAQEKLIPFSWESWEQLDGPSLYVYMYCQVIFRRDFGNIEAGNYDYITVNYAEGIIETYNNDKLVVKQEFKCVPIKHDLID